MENPTDEDEFKRNEVSSQLQPQLRLYRRLVLARIDIDEAKAIAEELITQRIAVAKNAPPSALLLALTTALVVSYSRPFVFSRGKSEIADKAVPGILLKVFTSKEREIHEELLNIRNKEVAHSDADISEIYLQLYEDGEGAIFRNVRAPFPRRILKSILKMIEKLEKSFDLRCTELRRELPLNIWI